MKAVAETSEGLGLSKQCSSAFALLAAHMVPFCGAGASFLGRIFALSVFDNMIVQPVGMPGASVAVTATLARLGSRTVVESWICFLIGCNFYQLFILCAKEWSWTALASRHIFAVVLLAGSLVYMLSMGSFLPAGTNSNVYPTIAAMVLLSVGSSAVGTLGVRSVELLRTLPASRKEQRNGLTAPLVRRDTSQDRWKGMSTTSACSTSTI